MNQFQKRTSDRIQHLAENSRGRQLVDLSTTGACLFADDKKAPETTVKVKIGELEIKSRVVYCRSHGEGYRIGVQFRNVDADTQKKIDQFVESYSKGVPLDCALSG
jgi:c-di-GMP-binding flagellar brake protein YcgR